MTSLAYPGDDLQRPLSPRAVFWQALWEAKYRPRWERRGGKLWPLPSAAWRESEKPPDAEPPPPASAGVHAQLDWICARSNQGLSGTVR